MVLGKIKAGEDDDDEEGEFAAEVVVGLSRGDADYLLLAPVTDGAVRVAYLSQVGSHRYSRVVRCDCYRCLKHLLRDESFQINMQSTDIFC